MSASVSPSASKQDKKDCNQVAQVSRVQAPVEEQKEPAGAAIIVIAPEKNLEMAIRSSQQGDILLYGPEGWYRLDKKALSSGTMVYVLGEQGSQISAFPKEAGSSTVR